MTKKKVYTAGDIATLAGATIQQVYSAKSRAKQGAVASFGMSKKIADVMAKHGITWDMLDNARNCHQVGKTAPVAKGKTVAKAPAPVAKETATVEGAGPVSAGKVVTENPGSVIRGKIMATVSAPVGSVAKVFTPVTVAKTVTGEPMEEFVEEPVTATCATSTVEKLKEPSAPEGNVAEKEIHSEKKAPPQLDPAALRSIGTGQIVRELKRRFPTATLSITF